MRALYFAAAAAAFLFALLSYGVLSLNAFSFLLFAAVVASVIYSDRKKIKFTAGIIMMRRTKRFRDTIDSIAGRHSRFWSVFGSIGAVVAVIVMIGGTLLLADQSIKIAAGVTKEGARLILPGPSLSIDVPGVLIVPWWIWVIAIAFVIIPHETMHGIMCRVDKVRIKSVGWILLLILPGAFVEPDEKQLKKSSRKTKLRVYAAGSFINVFLAAVIFLMLVASSKFIFAPAGIAFYAGENSSFGGNITGSIREINGAATTSVASLREEIAKYKAGDVVDLKISGIESSVPAFRGPLSLLSPETAFVVSGDETRSVELTEEEGRTVLGIRVIGNAYVFSPGSAYLPLYVLLVWMFIISFLVGLVNILPIKPLDGGYLFEEIVRGFTKRDRIIVMAVSASMLMLLLFNVFGPIALSHI